MLHGRRNGPWWPFQSGAASIQPRSAQRGRLRRRRQRALSRKDSSHNENNSRNGNVCRGHLPGRHHRSQSAPSYNDDDDVGFDNYSRGDDGGELRNDAEMNYDERSARFGNAHQGELELSPQKSQRSQGSRVSESEGSDFELEEVVVSHRNLFAPAEESTQSCLGGKPKPLTQKQKGDVIKLPQT